MLDADRLSLFLDEAGLVPNKQNSVSYIFDCPRCGKRDKLYIRKRDGRFVCWYCREIDNFHGRPEFALSELLQQPLNEVRKALYGVEEPSDTPFFYLELNDFFGDEDEVDEDASEVPTVLWPLDYYPLDHPFAQRGRDYLLGRGIPFDVAQEYGLHYIPKERRVAFPIHLDGRLVGWQKRLVIPDTYWDEGAGRYLTVPKVLSSTGIPRDRTLMFADKLKGASHAVVCEGPIDALKCHLVGGNVATMGKAVSRGQVALLRNAGIKRVYLGLDPDAASEIARLAREFSDLDCYLLQPPKPYKDLGDMPMERVPELFDVAIRLGPGNIVQLLSLGR